MALRQGPDLAFPPSIWRAKIARPPPPSILAALGFEPGQSIFGADIQSARLRLMQLEWVAEADVSRRYPDSISVTIVEKIPYALWQGGGGVSGLRCAGRH